MEHSNDAAVQHSNEYMQELPESVQRLVGSVYLMLANRELKKPEKGGQKRNKSRDLQQNATKPSRRPAAKLLKGLVGTAGYELRLPPCEVRKTPIYNNLARFFNSLEC